MKLGILSERQTTKRCRIWQRGKGELQQLSSDRVDGSVWYLPYNAEELHMLARRRAEKRVTAAIRQLRRQGAERVVGTVSLLEALPWIRDLPEVTCGPRGIPRALLPEAARYALRRFGISGQCSILHLCDRNLETVSLKTLQALCMEAKTIFLYTDRMDEADVICEELMDGYGVYPEVRPYRAPAPARADMLLDADRGVIRVGRDFVLDGVALDVDLAGIEVADADVTACLREEILKYPIKNFCSGKNKLTI